MTSMYSASPFQSRAPRAFAGAYQQVQVHTDVDAASPHRLVTMLFDGFVESLAQASGALHDGDVALKGRAIGRAVRIVDEGLKAALDLQNGGALAADLSQLYAYVTLRLTQANLHNDRAALDECKRLIEPLRDAWKAIGSRVDGAR